MTNTPEPSADVVEAIKEAWRCESDFACDALGEYLMDHLARVALSASPAPSQSGLVDVRKRLDQAYESKPRYFRRHINSLSDYVNKALRTNDQTAPDGLVGKIKLEECDTDEQVAAYWHEQCQIARKQLNVNSRLHGGTLRQLLKFFAGEDLPSHPASTQP